MSNFLFYFLQLKFRKETHFYVEIIICDPLVYTMDHPKFIAWNQKEESIRA